MPGSTASMRRWARSTTVLGRYIELVAERTVNPKCRTSAAELRAATDDTLSADDDHYSEQRFLDVQRIIERFRGRDGHADADRSWTRRVTDVRNWFTFSASERDRETDEEWEHYRDSDGKSGGQKEKLAYTILAASLAYQFGLEWGARELTRLPIRGDRRGVWPRLGRVDPLCAGLVRPSRPATADRDPAAEGARDRAVRAGDRLRRQPVRQLLSAADADHRGVPRHAGMVS